MGNLNDFELEIRKVSDEELKNIEKDIINDIRNHPEDLELKDKHQIILKEDLRRHGEFM